MILFANAKINIGLTVGEIREDGYHNISGIFYPIPLCDIIEIIPAEKFHFQSTGIPVNNGNNLIIKTFESMKSRYAVQNVFIHLHKQIPLGAGLGGGSSDAAFTLKGLNELFQLQLDNKALESLALEIGSDCPFFIENKPAKVSGRGEILEPGNMHLKGKFIKIVYPDLNLSTAEAFQNLIRKGPVGINELSLSDMIRNDFDNYAFQQYPQLKELKQQLLNEGAYFASMTGSGSAIYGLYHEKPIISTAYIFEKILLLE